MKALIVLFSFSYIIVYTLCSCNATGSQPLVHKSNSDSLQLVKCSEYFVNTIGCDDCFSPKRTGPDGLEIDKSLRLSDYLAPHAVAPVNEDALKYGWSLFSPDFTAAIGPWDAGFSANIALDETGVSGWTEAQFIKSIRKDKSKGLDGNCALLPLTSWQNFKKLNNDDLKSVYAYLKTTAPVKNITPAPIPLKDIRFKREVRKV